MKQPPPQNNIYDIFVFLKYLLAVEAEKVYKMVPMNTMLAPRVSFLSHGFPNHQTLMHRLRAFRVVKTRFVDTDDTDYYQRVKIYIR
jgi:hypothetical protein